MPLIETFERDAAMAAMSLFELKNIEGCAANELQRLGLSAISRQLSGETVEFFLRAGFNENLETQ